MESTFPKRYFSKWSVRKNPEGKLLKVFAEYDPENDSKEKGMYISTEGKHYKLQY